MVDPAKLDRRVTIQQETTERGAAGGVIQSFSVLDTVWAEKIEQGAREFRAALAVHAEAQRAFRIRYRSDLTTKHRIVFGGQFHDILGVTEEGRRETLLIACKYTEGAP